MSRFTPLGFRLSLKGVVVEILNVGSRFNDHF